MYLKLVKCGSFKLIQITVNFKEFKIKSYNLKSNWRKKKIAYKKNDSRQFNDNNRKAKKIRYELQTTGGKITVN